MSRSVRGGREGAAGEIRDGDSLGVMNSKEHGYSGAWCGDSGGVRFVKEGSVRVARPHGPIGCYESEMPPRCCEPTATFCDSFS